MEGYFQNGQSPTFFGAMKRRTMATIMPATARPTNILMAQMTLRIRFSLAVAFKEDSFEFMPPKILNWMVVCQLLFIEKR
jgi:hypothetical protein